MKLHNYTVLYLSVAMFLVLSIWAGMFYLNMLSEIEDSIDDGLENSKMLVINKTIEDTSLLYKDNFRESNYRIREVRSEEVIQFTDIYSDTLMFTQNEKDYEPFRMLTTMFQASNGKYYKLRVISSTVEEDDLMEDLLYSLLALYAILVLSMILVNHFLLRRIWKAFYEVIDKTRGYKISTHDEIIFEKTSVDEFALLQRTLKDLIQSNRETFDAQKQFIENASHELQTPLAISINKLELLAEKNNFSDEQLKKLSEVIDSLERLTRLNKSLLLLSKIENRQFPETEIVDINTLVKKLTHEFAELIQFKSINISIEEKGNCYISINTSLAEVLLMNLLKNAISHTPENGAIHIILDRNSIVIDNTGDKKLDSSKIFSRFYKASNQAQSTGLGLAIVQSIVDLYGFQICYEFEQNKHRFIIML